MSSFFGLIKIVWLVQNCRSNKCLQFLKPPELPGGGGLAQLGPGLPGLCLGPAGDLKRSPDPSPTHAPLTTNPGSAPDFIYSSFTYACILHLIFLTFCSKFTWFIILIRFDIFLIFWELSLFVLTPEFLSGLQLVLSMYHLMTPHNFQ